MPGKNLLFIPGPTNLPGNGVALAQEYLRNGKQQRLAA